MTFQPKKILVATDFSPAAREAADAAVTLARSFGAELALLHAIPIPTYVEYVSGMEASAGTVAQFQEGVRKAVARDGEQELGRLAKAGIKVSFAMIDGPPASEITAYARDNKFDLIVIGSHGRTGLGRLLLGSVAENVVRHATVPVLTIRAPTS